MKMLECSSLILCLCFTVLLLSHGQIEDNSENDNPLVECETTKGSITIEVIPSWAPLGAARFLELIDDNFFTDIALFRCVPRFLAQFGISDNPERKHWHNDVIRDDPSLNLGIHKGYVSFAGSGPNSRSTHIFIAYEDLDFLGKAPWETPFGKSRVPQFILVFLL
jgi:peptidyl-prolyl cis-trans isomerase A (cyclophilin A)